MTLSTTTVRGTVSGSGSAGPFSFLFKIFAATDLLVQKTSTTGVVSVLNYPTDYTVSGIGNASGGTLTLTVALAVGESLSILRAVPNTQPTSFRSLGTFFPASHEDEFDRLTMLVQQNTDAIKRSARIVSSLDPAVVGMELTPSTGKVLGWASGTQLTNLSLDSSAVAIPGNGRVTTTLSAYLANNAVANVLDYASTTISDGVTDGTTAAVAAITALPTTGGDIYFPPGKYVINGDLSAAINAKRFVRFVGANGRTFRGNVFPPYPAATTLYLKNRTTYLFVLGASSSLEAFGLKDIAIDGSNGGGTANGSTTCPGVFANNSSGASSYFFTAQNVICTDFSYSHASLTGPTGRAIFDLDFSVLPLFENCYFGYCQNGRIFFTDNGSTTFTARKCTMQGVREIYYHRNTLKALYDDCVFESSVVAGASYLSSVIHRACHYEALGANTGTAVWTTGLAPRNHGIGGGIGTLLAGNINTAIQQLYGSLVIETPTFNNLNDGPYTAWMECLGVAGATGVGGALVIRDPRKNDPGLTDTLFSSTMAFSASERGTDFSVHLEDAWGTIPVGAVINKADDMRKCNSGRVRVHFNDGTNYMATIKRGRYWIELQEQSTSPTAAPTSYPRNDQNQVGDVIILPAPAASGNIGLVCTTAGTPGTWKTFGAISA